MKADREEAFRPIGRWCRSEPASTDWRLLASLTQEYRPDPVYTASPRTAGPRYWQDGLVRSSSALLDVVSSCTQGTGCSGCAVTMITRSGGGGGGAAEAVAMVTRTPGVAPPDSITVGQQEDELDEGVVASLMDLWVGALH